jgi:hypothetical protein
MLGETGMVRGGAPLVVSGGDGNTISGYFILETTQAEAEALAALAPAATRGGRVAVVPHYPMPGMSN